MLKGSSWKGGKGWPEGWGRQGCDGVGGTRRSEGGGEARKTRMHRRYAGQCSHINQQARKHTAMQARKHTATQARKHTAMQARKYTTMQARKHTAMQARKHIHTCPSHGMQAGDHGDICQHQTHMHTHTHTCVHTYIHTMTPSYPPPAPPIPHTCQSCTMSHGSAPGRTARPASRRCRAACRAWAAGEGGSGV